MKILMALKDDDCGSMMEINDMIQASGAREQAGNMGYRYGSEGD